MNVAGALLLIAASAAAPHSEPNGPEQNIPQQDRLRPSFISRLFPSFDSRRFIAVKTDIVPWAATIMNLEGELQLSPHISATLPIWWCPWKISESHSLKILALLPEGRWWIKAPGVGHFFGLHFSAAWFNLRHGSTRYQDSGRPLLGGGISYGYSVPLAPLWSLQLEIGAGFASMQYERFYNIPNGARIDTRRTSYWGIDRLGVSITYNLNH